MNVFSGARRAGAAIAVATVIGVVAATAFSSTYASLTLGVKGPWGHASLLTNCPDGSAYEYKTILLPSAKSGHLVFCFEASLSNDGRTLVPFARDGEQVIMNERYSRDVTAYTKQYADRYVPDITIIRALEEEHTQSRRDGWIEAILGCLIGLSAWYVLMRVVGWIARGFMGIPSGLDKRPEA